MDVSRRAVLGGLSVAGLAAAGLAAPRIASADPVTAAPAPQLKIVPFYGKHQAGITTLPQTSILVAAVTLASAATDDDVLTLLTDWTTASAAMCANAPVPNGTGNPDYVDSGEIAGSQPRSLTITMGLGLSFFSKHFAGQKPARLQALPDFTLDLLDPSYCDGDIVFQICSDDPQVNFHAFRQLLSVGNSRAFVRWYQTGFRGQPVADSMPAIERNLFGFHDGIVNNVPTEQLWQSAGDQSWMAGGSYLVVRRINLAITTWDGTSVVSQEKVIGRHRDTGAPLSGGTISTPPDLAAIDANGKRLIAANAHVRLAAAASNHGSRLLRRSYSYDLPNFGQLFLAYQSDPMLGFVPIMQHLSQHDALNAFIQHVGSGVYAIPRGLGPGETWGELLQRSVG